MRGLGESAVHRYLQGSAQHAAVVLAAPLALAAPSTAGAKLRGPERATSTDLAQKRYVAAGTRRSGRRPCRPRTPRRPVPHALSRPSRSGPGSRSAGRATSPWATGATATLPVPWGGENRLVMPVVDLMPGSTAVTTWSAEGTVRGPRRVGRHRCAGASPAPGALLPVMLPRELARDATALQVATASAGGDEARVNAVMLEPLVSRYVLAGDGHATALLRSADSKLAHAVVRMRGSGPALVEVYDGTAPAEPVDHPGADRTGHGGTWRVHLRPALTHEKDRRQPDSGRFIGASRPPQVRTMRARPAGRCKAVIETVH